jgi:hypothetical protein
MQRKVVKKIESMVDKSEQEDLIHDIETLQLAQIMLWKQQTKL